MPTARSKKDLPQLAHAMASGLNLVVHRHHIYMPVDFETLQPDLALSPDRTAWVQQSYRDIIGHANAIQDSLFQSEADKVNFVGMLKQLSETDDEVSDRVLIRTADGLRELRSDGQLHDPSWEFTPNYITVPLNEDKGMQAELFAQFVEWVDSSEDAISLLHHLATALNPKMSVAKYVLLIGNGRNGKSLILKMLTDLFGRANVSHVTRQQMSSKSQECHDLTNKLLNVVFDGEATYLKESGAEKTLTAGEPIELRRLYESHPTTIQTNGLFIEGLNREPKTSDKSSALQKRLVRFYLPNVYALDNQFEHRMRSQEMLGALLALLVDHYVKPTETTDKLAPTAGAVELKLEYARANNLAMQFLEHVEHTDSLGADTLIGEPMTAVVKKFQAWRLIEANDIGTWNGPDVETLLRPLFTSKRTSVRTGTKVHKIRHTTGFTAEATEFLEYLRGEGDTDDSTTALVADEGDVHDVAAEAADQPE